MKKKLGKSGIEVSALGMGCWAIGGPWLWKHAEAHYSAGWGETDDQESLRALRTAIDAGINFFDTAANYGAGHSERLVGKAIAGKRDQVVIATKFGHVIDEDSKIVYRDDAQILKNIREDCENSLRRLNTDYIDIYQLHEAEYSLEQAPLVMEVLEDLVSAGKIRWYGWSTDLVPQAEVFAEGAHCTSIQFALNLTADNPGMRKLCANARLAGINKSPLSRGILTGKFQSDHLFPDNDVRSGLSLSEGLGGERLRVLEALREVLTANGHTLAQASLAYIWALDENMVPIPGFKSAAQVKENIKAIELGPLSEEQMTKIKQVTAQNTSAAYSDSTM